MKKILLIPIFFCAFISLTAEAQTNLFQNKDKTYVDIKEISRTDNSSTLNLKEKQKMNSVFAATYLRTCLGILANNRKFQYWTILSSSQIDETIVVGFMHDKSINLAKEFPETHSPTSENKIFSVVELFETHTIRPDC